MPWPHLIAATLSRRTSRAALCVIGNSIAGHVNGWPKPIQKPHPPMIQDAVQRFLA